MQEKIKDSADYLSLELGYLYGEGCDVFAKDIPLHVFPEGKWINVAVPPINLSYKEPSGPESEAPHRDEESQVCSHCSVTLRPIHSHPNKTNPQAPALHLGEGKDPRFDGTVADSKPSPPECTCGHLRRSDAVLLIGLALTCQDLGHVSVQSLKVLLHRDQNVKAETTTTNLLGKRLVSILITFSIPEVTLKMTRDMHRGASSQPPTTRRRFMTASSKPLPPSTQLLLSLLRTDWGRFDSLIQGPSLETDLFSRRARQKPPSIFPTTIALDEVYQRICGAASSAGESFLSKETPHVSSTLHAISLPNDVWKEHIGSFLKAKSLDSLRCTCKHLHHALRSVVPGLKLRLYAHQVKSLSWMRFRETKSVVENDMSLASDQPGRGAHQDGDVHRAASGGASVLLRHRYSTNECVRISQYSGHEIVVRSDDPLSRKVARGGLLCDDPGLGKTITVVSLILQTLGLSTETFMGEEKTQDSSAPIDDEHIFAEYWREQVVPEFRCQSLTKLLSTFLRSSPDVVIFFPPVDPELDGCPDYLKIVKKPICLKEIQNKINRLEYGDTFVSFQSDVELCFSNAILYHPEANPVHQAALQLRNTFHSIVESFKQRQVQAAKKSFSRASSKPNSSVAALVEKNKLIKIKQALVKSPGTLLVVPSVLLEHWQDQLRLHIDLAYITHRIPVIFEYSGTARCGLKMEEILVQCSIKKTHYPFVFVDKTSTKKLPSPHFLAMFHLVITTNQRFTNEWKNGSFEDELKRESEDKDFSMHLGYQTYLTKSEESCPLLKVYWLRMIVDEGHSMGRGKDNSAISFASWVAAERRWAMTGTPTRQTSLQSGLSNILNLLGYLQHQFFTRRQEGEAVWQNLVSRGWSRGLLASFFRLRGLLSLLMVRHTKCDIEELPPPHYHTKVLPMSAEEVKTYNTLVCAVQSNLLITSMEGKISGVQDSLLHKSQARHARDALRNVRLVCAGGTQVIPTVSEKYWNEFFRDLRAFNPGEQKMEEVMHYLQRATSEQLSPCACCGIMLTTLLVFPCGDLVCSECVDRDSNKCMICDREFDVDLFQRLQPGMDYQWLHNIETESKKTKNEALALDSEVQALEGGAGVLFPSNSLQPRRRTRKPGDGHTCTYSAREGDGKCELCWKEHDSCNLVINGSSCEVCFRKAEACPSSETKASYIVDKLLGLYESRKGGRGQCFSFRPKIEEGEYSPAIQERRLKVIVFSQFRKVLNMAGDRLLRRFGTACIAEYWGQYRKQELHRFVYEDDCFCMLLGKDGSEGLDLSFVTHIIFLEQVWDKSLEQQAVARAWRMGAKGSVEVETLVAGSSVEQTMYHLETNLDDPTNGDPSALQEMKGLQSATEGGKASEYQRAKQQFLLKSLRLITNAYTSRFGESKLKLPPRVKSEDVAPVARPTKKRKKLQVCFKGIPSPQLK